MLFADPCARRLSLRLRNLDSLAGLRLILPAAVTAGPSQRHFGLRGESALPTADKTVRTAQSRQGFLRRDLPSSDRNQPTPDSQCNRFGSGGRAELVKNRADVELDRMLGDSETRCDVFVDE